MNRHWGRVNVVHCLIWSNRKILKESTLPWYLRRHFTNSVALYLACLPMNQLPTRNSQETMDKVHNQHSWWVLTISLHRNLWKVQSTHQKRTLQVEQGNKVQWENFQKTTGKGILWNNERMLGIGRWSKRERLEEQSQIRIWMVNKYKVITGLQN